MVHGSTSHGVNHSAKDTEESYLPVPSTDPIKLTSNSSPSPLSVLHRLLFPVFEFFLDGAEVQLFLVVVGHDDIRQLNLIVGELY